MMRRRIRDCWDKVVLIQSEGDKQSSKSKSFDHVSFAQPASPMFGQPPLIIHIFSHSSAAFDDWYNIVFLSAPLLLYAFLLLRAIFRFPWWIHICPRSWLTLVLNDGSTKDPDNYGFFANCQNVTIFQNLQQYQSPDFWILWYLKWAVFGYNYRWRIFCQN